MIKAQVEEWNKLDIIIKAKSKELRELKKQQKIYMNSIQEYLENTKQPGLKYKNTVIYKQEKTKRVGRKKQEDQINDSMRVLESHGINGDNAQEIIGEIIEAIKGEEVVQSKVIMENIDKYKRRQQKK